MTDVERLRQFAATRCEEAFTQLVRQHVDMVYSAALRQTRGNADVSEEITQKVFVLLAQKAATLGDEVLLGGWLFNAVRLFAREAARKAKRRAFHEKKAAEMADELRHADAPGKEDPWQQADAELDEAMARLGAQSRGLIVLRFFEGKTAREVADRLGISEDAARKRLSRAVDELRDLFARRGVALSATALGEALAASALTKAPAGLAGSATSAALSSAVTTTAAGIKTGALIMAGMKVKTIALVGIGALFLGGAVVGGVAGFQYLSSPGKARTINLADIKTNITGPKIAGTILGPDGKPVAGAEIRVGTTAGTAYAYSGRQQAQAVTDSNGQYEVGVPSAPYMIVVRSPNGYAEVSSQKLAGRGEISLQAWGRIEGIAKAGDQPLAKSRIHLWRVGENDEAVHHEDEVTTDAQGHFVFPQVAPGGVQIYRFIPGRMMRSADWQYVEVEPGKTSMAPIGGNGASVVGRIDVPPEMASYVGWDEKKKEFSYDAEVRLDMPPQRVTHDKNESPEEYRAKEEAFGRTEAGKIWKRWMFGSNFGINADGTFRIDNLPPGKYALNVRSFEEQPEVNFLEDVAKVEGKFEIAAPATQLTGAVKLATSAPSQPIDIGTFTPKNVSRLRPGAVAPQFSIKTNDGKTFNSADYSGKLIAVVFWGTWNNTQNLKGFGDLAREWKNDPRIVFVGNFTTDDEAVAKKMIADNKLEFPQSKDEGLMTKLDSSWPEAVLISADGKLIMKHLQPETLDKFARKALGMEPKPTKKGSRRGT